MFKKGVIVLYKHKQGLNGWNGTFQICFKILGEMRVIDETRLIMKWEFSILFFVYVLKFS